MMVLFYHASGGMYSIQIDSMIPCDHCFWYELISKLEALDSFPGDCKELEIRHVWLALRKARNNVHNQFHKGLFPRTISRLRFFIAGLQGS